MLVLSLSVRLRLFAIHRFRSYSVDSFFFGFVLFSFPGDALRTKVNWFRLQFSFVRFPSHHTTALTYLNRSGMFSEKFFFNFFVDGVLLLCVCTLEILNSRHGKHSRSRGNEDDGRDEEFLLLANCRHVVPFVASIQTNNLAYCSEWVRNGHTDRRTANVANASTARSCDVQNRARNA